MRVFGYGSLLNKESLLTTCPSASNIQPGIVSEYVRVFDVPGCYSLNPGPTISVLNLRERSSGYVNGVVFEVNDADYQALGQRESEYFVDDIPVLTRQGLLEAKVYLYQGKLRSFDMGNKTQHEYLEVCLRGAWSYGEDFFRLFLDSTLVHGKSLTTLPELWEPIAS